MTTIRGATQGSVNQTDVPPPAIGSGAAFSKPPTRKANAGDMNELNSIAKSKKSTEPTDDEVGMTSQQLSAKEVAASISSHQGPLTFQEIRDFPATLVTSAQRPSTPTFRSSPTSPGVQPRSAIWVENKNQAVLTALKNKGIEGYKPMVSGKYTYFIPEGDLGRIQAEMNPNQKVAQTSVLGDAGDNDIL